MVKSKNMKVIDCIKTKKFQPFYSKFHFILKKINSNVAKHFKLQSILNMSSTPVENGNSFEELCKTIFSNLNFKIVKMNGASINKSSGDGGVDLVIQKQKKNFIVQCKNQVGNISVKTVREFCALLFKKEYSGYQGYICTTAKFTKPALDYIKEHNASYPKSKLICCDYNWVYSNMSA